MFKKCKANCQANDNLYLRGDVFYYMVELPRQDGKRRYFIKSLHTKNYYEALEKAKNMKKAVELLAEKLKANGCPKVVLNDLAREDMAECVEDAFRYGKIVLATTTYNADIFPFMKEFINHLTERGFKNKTVALMENGSWAPQAARTMKVMLDGCKDITYTDTTVKIMSAMNDESTAQINALAKELTKEYTVENN